MSLMGIDVGTTGCKATVFTHDGTELANAYEEYDLVRTGPGIAELDSVEVWNKIQSVIRNAAQGAGDPVSAISVTSMGEALVPVDGNRNILGNSITSMDGRGTEFVKEALSKVGARKIHRKNGNIPGIAYSAPKLRWHKTNTPELYEDATWFLLWADAVPYLLGGEPVTNFSHANRTLLFDLEKRQWSNELASAFGLDTSKLAPLKPAAAYLGTVSQSMAKSLGLSPKTTLYAGGHDQCCGSLGCGAVTPESAMFGLGTYLCLVPIYRNIENLDRMWENGLNIEHHVDDSLFVSFIYHASGGGLVKWYRDVFAKLDTAEAARSGRNIYEEIFAEIPERDTDILVAPRFGPTGPPHHHNDAKGAITNLSLEHTRGDILKAMIEGMTFYFRDALHRMEPLGISPNTLIATGGGATKPVWLQMTADILEKNVAVPASPQAGTLGTAMLAGIGSGIFKSYHEAVDAMVKIARTHEPDRRRASFYRNKFEQYRVDFSEIGRIVQTV
jgi:xylulokinase